MQPIQEPPKVRTDTLENAFLQLHYFSLENGLEWNHVVFPPVQCTRSLTYSTYQCCIPTFFLSIHNDEFLATLSCDNHKENLYNLFSSCQEHIVLGKLLIYRVQILTRTDRLTKYV